jgi:hypothetical protein
MNFGRTEEKPAQDIHLGNVHYWRQQEVQGEAISIHFNSRKGVNE